MGKDGWIDGHPMEDCEGYQCARIVESDGYWKLNNDYSCTSTLPGILCNLRDDADTESYETCGIECDCPNVDGYCFVSIKCEENETPECYCQGAEGTSNNGFAKAKCGGDETSALKIIGQLDSLDDTVTNNGSEIVYGGYYLLIFLVIVVVANVLICYYWWNCVEPKRSRRQRGYKEVEMDVM